MPTACWYGPSCEYKPRCRYYHPEGGNSVMTTKTKPSRLDEKTVEVGQPSKLSEEAQESVQNSKPMLTETSKGFYGQTSQTSELTEQTSEKPVSEYTKEEIDDVIEYLTDRQNLEDQYMHKYFSDLLLSVSNLKLLSYESIEVLKTCFGHEWKKSISTSPPEGKGQVWEWANDKMLANVNKEKYLGFIQEQVNLLGGCSRFYKKVAETLKDGKLDGFIYNEQGALYEWRSKFFSEKFKCRYKGDLFPSEGGPSDCTFFWSMEECEDHYGGFNVKAYQIIENFDEVMKLAASTVTLDLSRERIRFDYVEPRSRKMDNFDHSIPFFEEWDDEWREHLKPIAYYHNDAEDEEGDYICIDEDTIEDEDYASLVMHGKLPESAEKRYDCVNCEGLKAEKKDCVGRKERYIEYLQGSKYIKRRYDAFKAWVAAEDLYEYNYYNNIDISLDQMTSIELDDRFLYSDYNS